MLSENIKTLRKQKGYSQEQLADRLNVVRQTVSKWEKGYSVPDADMLEELADIFEVQVGDLLGKEILTQEKTTDIGELVKQLTILNEYFAEKVRKRKKAKRVLKKLCSIIFIVAILFSMYLGIGFLASQGHEIFRDEVSISIICKLEDEEYRITMNAWKDTDEIHSISKPNDMPEAVSDVSGDNLFDLSADDALKEIESFFKEKGGSCEIIYEDLSSFEKILEKIL